jgi:hypothetical protein
MLRLLFNFALRPFRRWWRRALVAAIATTIVYPIAREYVTAHVTNEHQTITIPR